jgi:homoserine kinase
MPRFRIPASTTNLGHGFDCLGIALACYNEVTVTPGPGSGVHAPGAAASGLEAMASQVRHRCQEHWGCTLPGVEVRVSGSVPIARGLGSSSTIIVGLAAAFQRLAGRPFDRGALAAIAADQEGHPDNAAAACFGGFTVVGTSASGLRHARFPVPADVRAVLAIPPYEVSTPAARRILPTTLSRADAVLGLQRTALITAALASGHVEDWRGLFDDAWHERYRADLNPHLDAARGAAHEAGALGTILSGSGSTVLSFATPATAHAVAAAVEDRYRRSGVIVEMRIVACDNTGVEALPDPSSSR